MSARILQAIKNAAARTGVDFSYLVKKAAQESGFDPTAKASTSSATGLYQFTSQTWLQMVKTYGAQYGLASSAAQITDSNGHLSVADPAARQAILALRNDPQISAEMAGELDKQNAASLQASVGGQINGTDLYLAHFLGAGGASDFLNTMRATPNASAASVLPQAAAANPAVFYNKNGTPRTLQQIYQHFARNFNGTGTVQVASAASAASGSVASSSSATTSTTASNAVTGKVLLASLSPAPKQASLYSSTTDGTSATPDLRNAGGAGAISLTGSSTLFATMILGQMSGLNSASPIDALSHGSDTRKKDAMSALYATV
ncbi:MAG: transglycosylase SLT domain-containing protein [Alphaproteobacteria bacterium]|nr:transglycosylase SLT domain-containing protein [Alphaproteobacteria bacterium]